MSYKVKKEAGEYVVVNAKGIIIAYCDNRDQAEDVITAQLRDEERGAVEAAYNEQQEIKALLAEFKAEFSV